MLYQVKKLSFVSVVELTPGRGSQYIRGSGTKGRIIKLDKTTYSAVLQLPSGVKKIFSYFSFLNLGAVTLPEKKRNILILKQVIEGILGLSRACAG